MRKPTWLLIGGVALAGVPAALTLGAATASGDTTGPPVSTYAPTASGSPGVGKTIRTTNGSWSTSATFTYQWLRCVKGYRACANLPGPPTYTVIAGVTAATYRPVAADVGHVLVARVTATNTAGSASVLSSGLGPVEARPPGVKHKPWIGGAKKVGHTVYETDDHWTRSPSMFRLQWFRCSSLGNDCVRITAVRKQCENGNCIRIKIGVQSDYKLTKKDVGHRLRVRVAAWNGAGRATSTSNPTRIIRK
jgi:hypothetical protein